MHGIAAAVAAAAAAHPPTTNVFNFCLTGQVLQISSSYA